MFKGRSSERIENAKGIDVKNRFSIDQMDESSNIARHRKHGTNNIGDSRVTDL